MGPSEKSRQLRGRGVADFADPSGNEVCRERTCQRTDAVRCAYSAPDGRHCTTSWCGRHRRVLGGVVYCRRHFNVLIALGSSANDPLALPDLDNRGPSLVNWVHRDLDVGARSVLNSLGAADAHSVRDPAVTVVIPRDGRRRWERGWSLLDGEGSPRHNVEVVVYDENDALVLLEVDGAIVAQGVPPWIDRHQRGIEVTAAVDEAQRRLFYSFLLEHLDTALAAPVLR